MKLTETLLLRGLLGRRLFITSLGARFSRSLARRSLGSGLLRCRLLGGFGRSLVAVVRRLGHLFLLRPRADRRLGVVGEDLGDAKHRELVAIAALAARVLAAALLERDHLRAALVVQHFSCNRGACDGGRSQRRRVTTEHQHFTQLHDRSDIAGDLANLEHIIRNDAVLPAAGFDDCEHRLIPSCSIPASGFARVGFLVSRYGYFSRDRHWMIQIWTIHVGFSAKTSGARNP